MLKRKDSIAFQMILIIVLLIFPMNIYMIYSASRSQEIILEDTTVNMQNIANLYVNELEANIQTINNFIMELENGNQFIEEIRKNDDWDSNYVSMLGLRLQLNDHITTYRDANAYFFYSEKIGKGIVVENSNELDSASLEEAVLSSRDLWADRKWNIVIIDDTKWLIHGNVWKSMYLGAGIQLDSLEQFIPENMVNENIEAVIDNQKEVTESSNVLTVTRQCGNWDIYLHIQVAKSEVIRNLPLLQRIGWKIAIGDFLIIPIMIFMIEHLVLSPLRILNGALEELKETPSLRIEKHASTDDFNRVFRSFNEMADEIVELKIHNYEQQIGYQKMELRNLQLQVKPHFLFNSLNLMYNLAAMGEYRSVQKMLLYFSNYFRYINVGDCDFSAFQEELELIEEYLEISAIRYPDIFEVEYQVDDNVRDAEVPQLLVHNFVENFIKHGLDLKRKNHLLLKAEMQEQNAVIIIQDDGVGMPKEQAEHINQGLFEYADGKRHLGLKNSYRRIQYFYGNQGKIIMDSEEGKGTMVKLIFPAVAGKIIEKETEIIP